MTNKELIKQYVGTGARLSPHQIDSLSNNLKKSYYRRRISEASERIINKFKDYEVEKASAETRRYIAAHRLYGDNNIADVFNKEEIEVYLNAIIDFADDGKKGGILPLLNNENDILLYMSKEQFSRIIELELIIPNTAKDKLEIIHLEPKAKEEYLERITRHRTLTPWQWEFLIGDSLRLFKVILPNIQENTHTRMIPDKFYKYYILYRINNDIDLYMSDWSNFPTEEERQEVLRFMIDNSHELDDMAQMFMSEETRDYYKGKHYE